MCCQSVDIKYINSYLKYEIWHWHRLVAGRYRGRSRAGSHGELALAGRAQGSLASHTQHHTEFCAGFALPSVCHSHLTGRSCQGLPLPVPTPAAGDPGGSSPWDTGTCCWEELLPQMPPLVLTRNHWEFHAFWALALPKTFQRIF